MNPYRSTIVFIAFTSKRAHTNLRKRTLIYVNAHSMYARKRTLVATKWDAPLTKSYGAPFVSKFSKTGDIIIISTARDISIQPEIYKYSRIYINTAGDI